MDGVAFKKTFSYAGFEMQPKRYDNPKIALLNVELELKAEKENAEIRVNSVEVRRRRRPPQWARPPSEPGPGHSRLKLARGLFEGGRMSHRTPGMFKGGLEFRTDCHTSLVSVFC